MSIALQSERKESDRIVFHVDVNSAYLSWTATDRLKQDPSSVDLRTIPSAVGGDVKTRHGVVTAKSIPAKKFGIKTGEAVMTALKKCPTLVLVKPDFALYRRYSEALMALLRQYSSQLDQLSIDEAFLEFDRERLIEILTGHKVGLKESIEKETTRVLAEKVAHLLKDQVKNDLGFTVNVGISERKLLAKMASDFTKPDRVHTLWPDQVPEKMWPLPIGDLYGCGGATAAKLKNLGIHTIGEAAKTDPSILKSILGEKSGQYIYESANGIREIHGRSERKVTKSYSNEMTIADDVDAANLTTVGLDIVHKLSYKVSGRLKKDGYYGSTITVNVKTDDFNRHSRQTVLEESTNEGQVIEKTARRLMNALLLGPDGLFAQGRSVRLIGVGVSKLDHGEYRQINLFDFARQMETAKKEKEEQQKRKEEKLKREREAERAREEARRAEEAKLQEAQKKKEAKKQSLADMMDKIQHKYGNDAVKKGWKV